MNDRDVMNKIIAKIKALEDVISGGGGGSESTSGVLVVHFSENADTTSEYDPLIADKTPVEIATALSNGNIVYATVENFSELFYLKTHETDADTDDGNFFYFVTLPTIYQDSIGAFGLSYSTGVAYYDELTFQGSDVN